MARFLIRRLLFGILVLWAVATVVFILFFLTHPDPARVLAGKLATPQTVAEIRHRLNLDQPTWIQYRTFIGNLLHGDLGYSYYSNAPVTSLIFQRVSVDISLALGGALLWVGGGVGIGVLAARRPRTKIDRAATAFVLTGISFPTFLLGILLLFVFFFVPHLVANSLFQHNPPFAAFMTPNPIEYVGNMIGHPVNWLAHLAYALLTLFPGGGNLPLSQDPIGWFWHLVLPWTTIALITAAAYSRLTRSTLLDIMGEDYIRTAKAKGLSDRRVVYVHGLRSALTPVVSQLGPDLGLALGGGAIITEQVFGLNGVARYALQSVQNQDLPVIMGTVIFAAFFIVLANIVVDMLYAVLDPRVRIS